MTKTFNGNFSGLIRSQVMVQVYCLKDDFQKILPEPYQSGISYSNLTLLLRLFVSILRPLERLRHL